VSLAKRKPRSDAQRQAITTKSAVSPTASVRRDIANLEKALANKPTKPPARRRSE
jgi:hypothetical protein